MTMLLVLVLLTSILTYVTCDYNCLCNYKVEMPIYEKDHTTILGYLYEFDCKPVEDGSGGDWIVIAYEHSYGWVQKDSNIQIQTCQGEIPSSDKVYTTTTVVPLTSVTSKATTTTTSKPREPITTSIPTTMSSSKHTTPTSTMSTPTFVSIKQTTATPPTQLTTTTEQTPISSFSPSKASVIPSTQTTKFMTISNTMPDTTPTTQSTTTIVSTKPTTTPTTTTTTTPTTTPSTTPTTTPTTTPATMKVTTKPITTSTTTKVTTKPTTPPTTTEMKTTSTTPSTTTKVATKPTTKPTTVNVTTQQTTTPITTKQTTTPITTKQTTRPSTTKQTTKMTTRTTLSTSTTTQPTTHSTTTQTTTTPTQSTTTPVRTTQAAANNCPLKVQQATTNASLLTVLGNSCYEAVDHKSNWVDAEVDCLRKNGNLFHISSAEESQFILNFLHTNFNHVVWMGLHDRNTEEKFEWASGIPVNYTHWYPGRKDDHHPHDEEDCVQFMIAHDGQWQDQPCHQYKFYMCQYSEPITYTNWKPGRHSQSHHGVQDCVDLLTHNGGHWDDIACSTNKHNYICQYNATKGEQTTTIAQTTAFTTAMSTAAQHVDPQGYVKVCPLNGSQVLENGNFCYEVVKHKATWIDAEIACMRKGGSLIHIASATEQNVLKAYLQKHSITNIWIGLHDRNREEHFEWASGEPVHYKHWWSGRKNNTPGGHQGEDCVEIMLEHGGRWNDRPCDEQYWYMCQYAMVVRPSVKPTDHLHTVQGQISLCPASVVSYATSHGNILGQYGTSCYELTLPYRYTWQQGNNTCKQRGGELVHIDSAQQQSYIESFMNMHFGDHSVWIGLHDIIKEGLFQWTSGAPVHYTNWVPGHLDNFASHDQEDCVVLVPYRGGYWDDIPCGSSGTGPAHPIICQYNTMSTGGVGGMLVGR